ncbi:MAG: hypothetical protein HQK97_00045 [Nitrospirae bacterium]|nr:hypothetical protein [Nitrospirota bacterium]
MAGETIGQSSDKLPDIYFRISQDAQVMFISDCIEKLTGWRLEEIKSSGALWDLFVLEGQTSQLMQTNIIHQLNEKGSLKIDGMMLKTRGGSPLPVSLQAYLFKEQDSLTTIQGTVTISSGSDTPHQSLHQLTKARQSAAAIAHEINNQLTNASLSIQLVMQKIDKSTTPEAVTKKLDTLHRNIDKAAMLSKDLMALIATHVTDLSINRRDRYIG